MTHKKRDTIRYRAFGKTGFHCTCGAAVNPCKETLLRKASETTVHAAGFGTKVRGLRPSDTFHGVYR